MSIVYRKQLEKKLYCRQNTISNTSAETNPIEQKYISIQFHEVRYTTMLDKTWLH